MSSKMKTLANAGIGVIIIAVTLAVFFAGHTNQQKEAVDWLVLTFTLIAEAALFSGIIITSMCKHATNKVLIRSGIISTLFIYWVITTIISIITRNIFVDNVGGFVTIQVIICAVTAIIVISLSVAAANIKAKDDKLINARLLMQDCENLVFSLKSNVESSAYSDLLNKMYEEIKYSDKTVSDPKEKMIYTQINDLSNYLKKDTGEVTIQDISKMVDEIILLIKERNLSVKQSKQGGF